MPETITIAGYTIGFGIFVLGLFVGTNLGVLLMALMNMASGDTTETRDTTND
ncbi:MAG TPA: hypothetical protein VMY98_02250 [Anaerolineae bacterium]|nr:hypothetical protein [Anaerolineae bacterium]